MVASVVKGRSVDVFVFHVHGYTLKGVKKISNSERK